MGLIMWTKEGNNNHLDSLTRQRMTQDETFNSKFYIMLFIILVIFVLGFVAGNVAHDVCCHMIEQSMK